jgi:hypothetical protein
LPLLMLLLAADAAWCRAGSDPTGQSETGEIELIPDPVLQFALALPRWYVLPALFAGGVDPDVCTPCHGAHRLFGSLVSSLFENDYADQPYVQCLLQHGFLAHGLNSSTWQVVWRGAVGFLQLRPLAGLSASQAEDAIKRKYQALRAFVLLFRVISANCKAYDAFARGSFPPGWMPPFVSALKDDAWERRRLALWMYKFA